MKWRGYWRCLIGIHHRSFGRTRRDGDDIRSPCRRCGQPLIKGPKGWRVARPSDEHRADGD